MAEDRELFRDAMREIGLEVPRPILAHSLEEALEKQRRHRFPDDHPARRSRWAVPAAASPTTARSSRRDRQRTG